MSLIGTTLPLLVVSTVAFGQSGTAPETFEVASVKPSAQNNPMQVNAGVHIDGAQVHISHLSLKDYIRLAYRVKNFQVLGPDWLEGSRYDLDATFPAGASRGKLPEMLQAMLAERFQLKTHRESKELPVYGLVVGPGGPKLKESPPDPEGAAPAKAVEVTANGGPGGVSMHLVNGGYFSFADDKIEARRLDMTTFADTFSRFMDRPIVDMTKLSGRYDFTVTFTPEDYRAVLIRSALNAGVNLPPEAVHLLEGNTVDSLYSGLRALGLKLEPRKAPLDVVVVDSVSKTPTEN